MELYTKDELETCRQMGTDPVEIYGERKAFADEDLLGLDASPADVPADIPMDIPADIPADIPVEEEVVEEEAIIDPLQEKKDRLQAIIDNEATEKADKDTAEELLARLEELGAALQNADDFLAEKEAVIEDEVSEETPLEEMADVKKDEDKEDKEDKK